MATAEIPVVVHVDPMFSGLYVLQRDFQALLHGDELPIDMEDIDRMDYIRTQALALTDELHEALAETGWKPWATSNHINRDAYMGELADVFIFFMNLMIAGDITPTELMTVVKAKQIKNRKRQDDGYDGVTTKCPGCKRAYDDDAVKCFPGSTPTYAWCENAKGYVSKDGNRLP